MLNKKIFRSKISTLGIICAFSILSFPVKALTKINIPTGSLVGFVYAADMETPVENAVVKIRDSAHEEEYQSNPTDKKGMYKIEDIKEGRYFLEVSTEVGDYDFEYQVFVKANEAAELTLALKPGLQLTAEQKKSKNKKLIGAAILIASATLVYGAYKLLKKENEKSPSEPDRR